jgi:PAS domain S-box-containing protein
VGNLAWWDWDVPGDRMTFSSRIEQTTGMDGREIGQNCEAYRSLIHPEDTGRVKSLVHDMLNGGSKVYDIKYRLKNRDGEYVWVRDRGGVVRRDGQGNIQEIAGILADINREKQLEIERDKSYELIYKSLDYSPVAKTVVDRDGAITFANKQARKMMQITESEIANRTYDDGRWRITSGDGKPIPAEDLPFSRVIKTGKPVYDFRHYIQVDDQTPILLSISGAPVTDDSGRVLSVVFTLDDITARTERENALRESEEQYRMLFECSMDAILVADTERRIMDANSAFEKLFGYSLDEIKGKNTSEIYAEQKEHAGMGESLKQQNPEGGFIKTIQYKKKDGTVFTGETSAFHLLDSSGDIRAFVGLIREE